MTKPVEMPADDASLRRRLHENADKRSGRRLGLLARVVQQLEVEELAQGLDRAFDDDRQIGLLTKEKLQEFINKVREDHPYGR